MIINTGCRTDIPAFYSKWFMKRIREGYVMVRNPYYPKIITKYLLNPSVVDSLEFCTKNPAPMLPYIEELKKFKQFWFVTITPYKNDIEINVPDIDQVINSFQELSQKLGSKLVEWRYDPIFFNKDYDINTHVEKFAYIAQKLKGYTNKCVISFLDAYEKLSKNAPDLVIPSPKEQIELVQKLVQIAKENAIEIYSCCENSFLQDLGVNVLGCRTKELIEESIGAKIINVVQKKRSEKCNCILGNDIGVYNSCGHLCRYCYANTSRKQVLENMQKHDENSPLLIGHVTADDIIKEANQKSFKRSEEQLSLFDV